MSIDERTPARAGEGDGVVLPRLGPVGWLRWAWRQLTSMKTALLLLMLLAVAAIPGSVFPQTRIDAGRVDTYLSEHPGLGPWLQRLNAFDVYASPWFSAIYLLLFVSLVGCVLPRSRQHLKAIRAVPPKAPRRLERMPVYRSAVSDLPAEELLRRARTVLSRRRYRLAAHEGNSLSAERGHWGETGNLAFHLALLGLLISIAAGSFLGYSGQALVVVGDGWANTLPQYDAFSAGRAVNTDTLPPFSFTLTDFKIKFDEHAGAQQFGQASDFEADVDYRRTPTSPVLKRAIKVNHPLDVEGARVFLVGNGYAPIITIRGGDGKIAAGPQPVPFLVTDSKYTSTGVVKAPDASPAGIGLRAVLLPTAAISQRTGQPISVFPDARNPRLLFTAYTGDLGLDTGVPSSVYVLDVTRMTQLSQNGAIFNSILAIGQSVTLPDGAGTVTFDGIARYAALNVRSDPTKVWVLLSALLALSGLCLSLFLRRRRIWVRVAVDEQGRTVVGVAGLMRQAGDDLTPEVSAIMNELLELSTAKGAR